MFHSSVFADILSNNSYGIFFGLFIGKPIGIFLFSWIGMKLDVSSLPSDLKMKHIFWAGLLAGIGFTMSIFITLLAFENIDLINSSKLIILFASTSAVTIAYFGLKQTFHSTNVS